MRCDIPIRIRCFFILHGTHCLCGEEFNLIAGPSCFRVCVVEVNHCVEKGNMSGYINARDSQRPEIVHVAVDAEVRVHTEKRRRIEYVPCQLGDVALVVGEVEEWLEMSETLGFRAGIGCIEDDRGLDLGSQSCV